MAANNEAVLNASIMKYLQEVSARPGADAESFEVAIQCLTEALQLKENSHAPTYSLQEIFDAGLAAKGGAPPTQEQAGSSGMSRAELDANFEKYMEVLSSKNFFGGNPPGSAEYQTRYSKAREKFYKNFGIDVSAETSASPGAASATPSVSDEEARKTAESFKANGNQFLSAKKYQEAVECYTEAIKCWPHSAIYFSNRAAARSLLDNHQEAINDCKEAIRLDPSYAKAYSRMGLAHHNLGNFKEAVAAYEKAAELDPGNKTVAENLSGARAALAARGGAGSAGGAGGAPPDFASMLGGMGQMFNNPDMMNMASQVASSPQFAEMMNNPGIQQMAMNMMQNPAQLNEMLSGLGGNGEMNEQMANLARQFGAPPPGGGSGGSDGGAGGAV